MFGSNRKPNYRNQGDRHRNARDWSAAASAYRRHLAVSPADQPIYVQLGHTLKEQGRLPEAMGAYATAVALNGRDADALRHLADALRRLGLAAEALATYERVNRIEPSEEAVAQAAALARQVPSPHARSFDRPVTLFSIRDLFAYLRSYGTLTGIQRVQAEISRHLIADAGADAGIGFILTEADEQPSGLQPGEFWMVETETLGRLLDYASSPAASRQILNAMISACETAAIKVRPAAGSTIMILGAFWGAGNEVQRYIASKRAGARIAAYVHDLLPLSFPGLFDDRLVAEVSLAVCELAGVADFLLAVSETTAQAVREFLAEHGTQPVAIATVPLAHQLTSASGADSTALPPALPTRPFVAFVGTIEVRKNHRYVAEAWRRMIAAGVPVPDLVFVGRRGWKVQPLFDLLESTNHLGGRVHILHDLSDEDLRIVYERCLFTVYPSFAEGWGLPVGESLAAGRPCLASDIPVLHEVGGDLVDYIDPHNVQDGVRTLRRLIEDDAYRAERAAAIQARFVARDWRTVATDFVRQVDAMQSDTRAMHEPRIAEAVLCELALDEGTRVDTRIYVRNPWRLMFDAGQFRAPDVDGIGMRGDVAHFTIPTDLDTGEHAFVYLSLRITSWCGGERLTIEQVGGTAQGQTVSVAAVRRCGAVRISAVAGEGGAIALRLRVARGATPELPAPPDGGPGVSLFALAYVRQGNLADRQDVTERMMFAA